MTDDARAAVRSVLDDPTQLRLVVQPIVDLAHASVAGYEVLTRLPDTWGLGPDEFFTAATGLGCSAQLSTVVLSRLRELRDTCPPNQFLTVNLSPRDMADPAVHAQFRGSWTGVIVELTEAEWPADHEAVMAGVGAARGAGAKIASDDAGAGYAGLLQLVRLRPDLVKVDRELVQRLGSDPAAESVLRMLGELSSQLDAWLLVEGVETYDQLAVAMRLGVPLAQGWLFGRPGRPWPPPTDLSRIRAMHARSTFTETVVAYLREPRPGELRIDSDGRPVAVAYAGTWTPALTMSASTPAAHAVQRALHRTTPHHRLAPLVVTDGQGTVIGVVDVEPLALRDAGPVTLPVTMPSDISPT